MYCNNEDGTYWCFKNKIFRLVSDEYGIEENSDACKYYEPERVSVRWINSEINSDELPF
jgi:hypothetical protein